MRPEDSIDLLALIRVILAEDPDVILIGGLAMRMQGGGHVTDDVDFAFKRTRDTVHKKVKALAPYQPRPLNWPEGVPYVWDEQMLQGMTTAVMETKIGRVDFLAEPDGAPPFDQLQSRATRFDVDGKVLRVASIDDLIAMKRAAGRPKDLAHIHELETIKKILAGEL